LLPPATIGGQRRIGTYHRHQRYDFTVNIGFDPVAIVTMTLPLVSVLILLTYFDDPPVRVLAAPRIRRGRRAAGLVHLLFLLCARDTWRGPIRAFFLFHFFCGHTAPFFGFIGQA